MELNNLIDISLTIKEFGYDPNQLKPSSEKLVIWFCSNCKEKLHKKFRQAQKNNFCLKCSNKINSNKNLDLRSEKIKQWYKNNTHPLEGSKRPDYVIKAMRDGYRNRIIPQEEIDRKKERFSGEKNPFYNKKHSEESLDKMRISARKNVRRGKNSNFYGKIYHGKKIKFEKGDKIFYFKSTWEYKTAQYFIDRNIKWEYEPRFYEMVIGGRDSTYTPDFFLPDYNKIIEVKGYWRDDAQEKFTKFIEQYSNSFKIELWDKEKLKILGIL